MSAASGWVWAARPCAARAVSECRAPVYELPCTLTADANLETTMTRSSTGDVNDRRSFLGAMSSTLGLALTGVRSGVGPRAGARRTEKMLGIYELASFTVA